MISGGGFGEPMGTGKYRKKSIHEMGGQRIPGRDSQWLWVAAAVVVGITGGLSGLFGDPRTMLAERRGFSVA
jgi:hypothetical protein